MSETARELARVQHIPAGSVRPKSSQLLCSCGLNHPDNWFGWYDPARTEAETVLAWIRAKVESDDGYRGVLMDILDVIEAVIRG